MKSKAKSKMKMKSKPKGLSLQELIFRLQEFWASHGCAIQQPFDSEVGAGTMAPETFLRVLGAKPYRVAYVQPARRPADGRYGDNPNRLYKHTQFQVVLKPAPADSQDLYLQSIAAIGIDLKTHDIRFEEDNWESPTLGAWGLGWQVLLDGLEVTQFTYFQQCGGVDLDPASVELTYGIERIAAFLERVDTIYDVRWADGLSYGDVRLAEEEQLSSYSFDHADIAATRQMFEICENEAQRLLAAYPAEGSVAEKKRYPLLAAYEFCLKCSHFFNVLDSRGAISTTERAAVIGRVRKLACKVAALYLDQIGESAERAA